MKPMIIGICGRSCSGKSYVSKELLKYLPDSNRINADMYFKKESPKIYREMQNFDIPESIDFEMLIKAVRSLKAGNETKIVSKIHTQKPDTLIKAKKYLLIEGILIFAKDELCDLFDNKIFLDISDENLIKRRTKRARSKYDTNLDYIKNVVLPSSKKFGAIQKKRADIIINANLSKKKVLEDVLDFLNIKS